MRNVKLFVTVRDRIESTKICITTLLSSIPSYAKLYIYDNSSCKDLDSLIKYYRTLMGNDAVANITFNLKNLQDVYWSKSYAWCQFLKELELCEESITHIVMIDNDVKFTKGWLETCIDALETPVCVYENVVAISPWNGPPRYKTIKSFNVIDDYTILDVRDAVGSPCIVLPYQLSTEIKTPPYGLKTAIPDDVWYWNKIEKLGYKYGVLTNGLVTDITPAVGGSNYSARLKFVGDKYPA